MNIHQYFDPKKTTELFGLQSYLFFFYELILREKNIYTENFGLDFYECLFPNVMLFLKYFCDEITIQLN